MLRLGPGAFIAALLVLSCAEVTPQDPAILAIEPAMVSTHEETDATIVGRNFLTATRVDLDGEQAVTDQGFAVQIGEVALPADRVSYIDTETIAVKFPAGLPVGLHDVVVRTPWLSSATLPGGLEVFTTLDLGAPCDADLYCTSGFCVDGLCCDQACDGACMACTAAETGGADGSCLLELGDDDGDGVPNNCDVCPGFDDSLDADSDGVADGCDACPGSDDALDADGDSVPDGCDACPGFDDSADADADGVADGCDVCAGFDDALDADGDSVPDGCDACAGFDDALDADGDSVPDGCDACPGFDDSADADGDGVADGCDVCAGFDDNVDADGDSVPDGCDVCAGFDDTADADGDGVPDGCDICPGAQDPVPPVDWWQTDYRARIPLTLSETAGGPLSIGYTVLLVIDTTGAAFDDSDDLRIIWDNAGVPTEIDRRVIGFGTASTEIWFKTQASISGSSADYSLYFDSDAPGAPMAYWSDRMGFDTPSAVYLAADSFEDQAVGPGPDPAGWEGSDVYDVLDLGGNKVLHVDSSGPDDADYLFAGDYTWGDVVVSARLNVQDSNATSDYYGLFVRAEDAGTFYTSWFGGYDHNSMEAFEMTITGVDADGLDGSTKLAGPQGVASLIQNWRTLRVSMEGTSLWGYFDDHPFNRNDALFSWNVGGSYTQGRIGLCAAYDAAEAYWDDITVRLHVYPEPTVGPGATENLCP